MLHYAMASFRNVILHKVESDIRYTPSLSQSLELCLKPYGSWLVTKREYGWFRPHAVSDIVTTLRRENIALVNVVRDPRDVLVSRHAGSDRDEFYVQPDRWEKSVRAGQQIVDAVSNDVPTLTLRYEDIVTRSEEIESQLIRELGVSPDPDLGGFSELEKNIEKTGVATTPWMRRALHSVRNLDPNSVGRWQQDNRKRRYLRNLFDTNAQLRNAIIEFMNAHSYDTTDGPIADVPIEQAQ